MKLRPGVRLRRGSASVAPMAAAKHPPWAQPRKGKGPGDSQFAAKPAPDRVAAPAGLSLSSTADLDNEAVEIGTNHLDIDSRAQEIDRVRADHDFTTRAKRLLERDKELLERLAK